MRKIYILFIILMSHYGGFAQDIKQHYLGFGYFGNVAEPDPYTTRYISEADVSNSTQEGYELNYAIRHNTFESSAFLGFVQHKSNFLYTDYRWPSEIQNGQYIPNPELPNQLRSELNIQSLSIAYKHRYYISPKTKNLNVSLGTRIMLPLSAERIFEEQVVEKPIGSQITNKLRTISDVKSEIKSFIPSFQATVAYKLEFKRLFFDLDIGVNIDQGPHADENTFHINRSVQGTFGMKMP
jgi:hypothetical protein